MLSDDDKFKAKNVIHGFTGEALEDIHEGSKLSDDLELDDIDMCDLAIELEEEFNIDIDDNIFENLTNVEGIYNLIGAEIA